MIRHVVLALTAFLAFGISQLTSAQEDEPQEDEKSISDYMDLYIHDPDELYELWQEAEKWKQLFGPFGLRGYYIPPSQEPGPYYGPPLQIWGRGSGTTLWRNPITGWPIQ